VDSRYQSKARVPKSDKSRDLKVELIHLYTGVVKPYRRDDRQHSAVAEFDTKRSQLFHQSEAKLLIKKSRCKVVLVKVRLPNIRIYGNFVPAILKRQLRLY
jgi:hypothetical protein